MKPNESELSAETVVEVLEWLYEKGKEEGWW